MSPIFNVAILLYPTADILDFAGPLEIYSCMPAAGKTSSFTTTTFAWSSPVKAGAGAMSPIPDAPFADIEANLRDYDILLVPGAMPDDIHKMLEREDGKAILNLIQRFATLAPRKETGNRLLQSVCSGALILAAAGILAGRTVTTHHICYDMLKEMADQAAGGESGTNVVRKRWVDAGMTDAGVRIVNAGGVSSGIDASLFVVNLVAGTESADWVAEIVEFERRGQDDAWGVEKV